MLTEADVDDDLIVNINVPYLGIDDGKEVINDRVLLAPQLPAGAGGGRVPGHDGPRTPAAAPCSLLPVQERGRDNKSQHCVYLLRALWCPDLSMMFDKAPTLPHSSSYSYLLGFVSTRLPFN